MGVLAEQRTDELSLSEVVSRYPDVPRLIAIKIDVQRRGVHYTDEALKHVDGALHQLRGAYIFGSRDQSLSPVPESLIRAMARPFSQTRLLWSRILTGWTGSMGGLFSVTVRSSSRRSISGRSRLTTTRRPAEVRR